MIVSFFLFAAGAVLATWVSKDIWDTASEQGDDAGVVFSGLLFALALFFAYIAVCCATFSPSRSEKPSLVLEVKL